MELAANGHSTREIGEVLGVDHSTVVRDGANAPQDEKHDENTDDNLDVVGANAPPIDPEAAPDATTLAPTFVAEGKVYGAAPGQSSVVTLKALKSASVIVRGLDGSVYFARQLAPGEAYRVPQLGGLSVETPDPDTVQVFVGGQSKGVLPSVKTALGALVE